MLSSYADTGLAPVTMSKFIAIIACHPVHCIGIEYASCEFDATSIQGAFIAVAAGSIVGSIEAVSRDALVDCAIDVIGALSMVLALLWRR